MKPILVLLLVFLTGCVVSQDDINQATEWCEPHDGVKWIYTFDRGVHCNDGVWIND